MLFSMSFREKYHNPRRQQAAASNKRCSEPRFSSLRPLVGADFTRLSANASASSCSKETLENHNCNVSKKINPYKLQKSYKNSAETWRKPSCRYFESHESKFTFAHRNISQPWWAEPLWAPLCPSPCVVAPLSLCMLRQFSLLAKLL